jgi:hypothetical protein
MLTKYSFKLKADSAETGQFKEHGEKKKYFELATYTAGDEGFNRFVNIGLQIEKLCI